MCSPPEKSDEHDSFAAMESLIWGVYIDDAFCRYMRRDSLAIRHRSGVVVVSFASRHTRGNVQTTVESATDIGGKHLFDRA